MEKINRISASIFQLGFWHDFRELAYISVPLILIAVIQISLQITSVIFAGQLGTAQLDGVSLANSIVNIVVFVSIEGLGTACDTLFPQLFGGDDKKKIGIVLQKAILISILSILVSGILILNASNLIVLITKEKEVAVYANQFLVYFLPAVIFFNIATVLTKYVQSQNIIYPLMVINGIVIVINIGFHWLFLFGLDMGVIGTALAIDIATFFMVIMIFLYVYIKKIYVDTWTPWTFECLYDWKMYLRLAIPGLLSLLIEWSNVEIGSLAAAALDEVELAVMSIGQQVMFIAFQVPYAIATAANIRVGQFLGANKPAEAKNAAKVTYALTAIDIVVMFFGIYFAAPIIPKIFDNDEKVLERAIPFIRLIPLVHFIDALQGTASGLIRAVGGQLYMSIIAIIGYYIIGSPIGLSLMFLTSTKIFGFMYGNMLGIVVINVLQIAYLTRLDWNKVAQDAHNQTIEEAKEIALTVIRPEYEEEEANKESSESEKETGVELEMSPVETSSSATTTTTEAAETSSQIGETSLRMDSTSKLIKMEEEMMRKWTKMNIRQLKKRLLLYVIAIVLFIVSIFTHSLTDFSVIILESLTSTVVSSNYTSEYSTSSDMYLNLF